MFMGKALKLCPGLVTIPYDFDGYNTVSKILYDTVARLVLVTDWGFFLICHENENSIFLNFSSEASF